MAKHIGAKVIGTTPTDAKAQVAYSHGCDFVINYQTQNVKDELNVSTNGKGCHTILSGVGKATFEDDLACTKRDVSKSV